MKKHDESKDLNLLRKKCNIDYGRRLISASKSTILGNSSWGRIDFLTHYCGWRFIWNNNDVVLNRDSYNNKSEKKQQLREAKKESKQHHLTNKNKNSKRIKEQ